MRDEQPIKETHFASEKLGYRPEIDGLRAFAVIAVIINHFNKDLLPSGYLGVDIFFVISGFVITRALTIRSHANLSDLLLGFYSRRVKRLLPALIFCVCISSILICIFNPDPQISLNTGIASLFGFSNIYLLKTATHYFATSAELNAFTQTWSLGIEEQFYFLFPFLIWFSGYGKKKMNGSRYLISILTVFSVASLTTFIYLNYSNQSAAYFLMPARLWELCAGCLVYLYLNSRKDLLRDTTKRLFIPPTALILILIFVLLVPRQFSVWTTIASVILTSLLIAYLHPQSNLYKIFTLPPILFLGLISYSLYLWHWTVLVISRWTIGIHWWTLPIQFAVMILLAFTSYSYIERPFRNAKWTSKKYKTIVYGIGISIFATISLMVLSHVLANRLYLGSVSNTVIKERGSISGTALNQGNCSWWLGKGPNLNDAIRNCTLTDKKGLTTKRMYVLGDSHAGHLAGLLQKLNYYNDFWIRLLYVHSQPAPNVEIREKPEEILWKRVDAQQQVDLVQSTLTELRKGDILILSNYLLAYFEAERNPSLKTYNLGLEQKWFDGLDALLKVTHSKGASVIVFTGVPDFPTARDETNENDYSLCSKEWFRREIPSYCQLSRKRNLLLNERKAIQRHLLQLQKDNPSLYIYDPLPVVCPVKQTSCSNYLSGTLIYYDNHHLNNLGGGLLYDDFIDYLRSHALI
ncbi:MAG: acyltransferase [Oscillatoriophycideae cyanobacterium NC_groundwater_1537_Pr4_S-0.65um_50_18]|nr:acyltransferase [Oscillatoriophycideae cyanobacterium NC_groundwater_1537_Pr4_S-0.65um_50_18]